MKKQTKLALILAVAAVLSLSVASLVSARGWVQQGADWYYVDNDGEYVTDTIQSSGNAKFYLGEDGAMMKDYFLEEYSGSGSGTYYFGSNGAMVTNTWVAIESSRVENQEDYVPDNYWYYFQASGKAMKASSNGDNGKKTTIDGKKYMFNQYGQMLTGWVTKEGKTVNPDDNEDPFEEAMYYAGGDNDGVLRSGWITYYDGYGSDDKEYLTDKANLYFYFNPSSNRKVGMKSDGTPAPETKKINGKTYAFNDMGIMVSGWDVVNNREDFAGLSISTKNVYFSGEDDGHQVKKGWVYDIPASSIDQSAYDDGEEKYMYFNNSGEAAYDTIKKINGKYYCFNRHGIMKTGLVIWCPNTTTAVGSDTDHTSFKFIKTLDLDYATGEELSKKGYLRIDDNDDDYIYVTPDGTVIDATGAGSSIINDNDKIVLHYFGNDGARKTGTSEIEFADEIFTFVSKNGGNKASGVSSKKYYSLGILLKANSDIRYGIYNMNIASDSATNGGAFSAQSVGTLYNDNLLAGNYLVLNTSGAKVKGNNTAKKDADGNYWFIEKQSGTLRGIFTVNVKYVTQTATTRAVRYDGTFEEAQTYPANELPYGLLAVDANEDLDCEWTARTNGDGDVWFEKRALATYYFQSDLRGGSNKWIPFGVYDDTGSTCTMDADCTADKSHVYEVTPTNDYFLNCYWAD